MILLGIFLLGVVLGFLFGAKRGFSALIIISCVILASFDEALHYFLREVGGLGILVGIIGVGGIGIIFGNCRTQKVKIIPDDLK